MKSSCCHCNRLCRKKAWSFKCEELSCNGSVFAYCSITYPKQRSLFVALCTPNGAFNDCLKLLEYIVRIVLTTWSLISVSINLSLKPKCARWNSSHVLWKCFKTERTKLLQLNLFASQFYISQIVNICSVVVGEMKKLFPLVVNFSFGLYRFSESGIRIRAYKGCVSVEVSFWSLFTPYETNSPNCYHKKCIHTSKEN